MRQHRARSAHAADAACARSFIACSRTAAAKRASRRRWNAASSMSIRCSIASARCCAFPSSRICAGAAALTASISARSSREVHELYAPLAEDSAIRFQLDASPGTARARRPLSPVRGVQQSRRERDQVHAARRHRRRARGESSRKARASRSSTAAPASRAASARPCCGVSIGANRGREAAGAGLRARAQHRVGDRPAARLQAAHRRRRKRRRARQRSIAGSIRSGRRDLRTTERRADTPNRSGPERHEVFFMFRLLACPDSAHTLMRRTTASPESPQWPAHEWNSPHRVGSPVHVRRAGAPDPDRRSAGGAAHADRHLSGHPHSGHRGGVPVHRACRRTRWPGASPRFTSAC